MQNTKGRFFWLAFFSIAMGFLEGAVVIYLRKIYYPDGFDFPLNIIQNDIALVEFLREAATLMMLITIGVIAGSNRTERLLFFCYCFGIWDLVYYAVLKIFLDWPSSILEWDILFLIPIPWVGPVLAPCIVSATMILIAVVFIKGKYQLRTKDVLFIVAGCLVLISSFCIDYVQHIYHADIDYWVPGSQAALFAEISTYVPVHYPWWVFWLGEGIILLSFYNVTRKKRIIS